MLKQWPMCSCGTRVRGGCNQKPFDEQTGKYESLRKGDGFFIPHLPNLFFLSLSPSLSHSLSLTPPSFFLLTLNPGNICNLVHGQGRMFTKALGPLLVYLEGRQSGSLSKCSRIVIQCRVVSWTVLYGVYSERLSISSWCHLSCGTQ